MPYRPPFRSALIALCLWPCLCLCLWLCLPLVAGAGEALATAERGFVTVTVAIERGQGDQAVLVGTFTPATETPTLHLYSKDLPPDGIDGLGRPTLIEIKPGEPAEATGPLTANHAPHDLKGLPVYPDGAVELRLPIRLPDGAAGGKVPVTMLLTYMACSVDGCKVPVVKRPLVVELPTQPRVAAPPAAGLGADAVRQIVREELTKQQDAVAATVAKEVAKLAPGRHRIEWRHPTTIAEIDKLIADAHAAGKSALLDFTGPSCSNCQQMAKSVFLLPEIAAAWNAQVPIEINTDPDPAIKDDLAGWQQSRFKTQNRPLYIRLDKDGTEARWSQVFSPGDTATVKSFLAFLRGGIGSDQGTGSGFWEFLVLAIFGGLFTLVMPCTYPMIPFTVNFFAKQAAGGKSVLPLATFYALGIIGSFTGVGVLITGVFHANLATIAGHPVTQLIFGLLFLVLGLSLIGVFLLRLPASLAGSVGGGRAGYLGALLMGLTFAVTAFSCTAPFAGSVLAQAVATGTWLTAVAGMAIYSTTIAAPFFVLAMSPGLMKKIPKAGEWMNEFKVVGGLVEIAAAFKFLAICDAQWGWGVIGRTSTLALWAVIAAIIAFYILGKIRLHEDTPVQGMGAGRLLTAALFLVLALWLAAGLFGHHLGVVEAWFPADEAPA